MDEAHKLTGEEITEPTDAAARSKARKNVQARRTLSGGCRWWVTATPLARAPAGLKDLFALLNLRAASTGLVRMRQAVAAPLPWVVMGTLLRGLVREPDSGDHAGIAVVQRLEEVSLSAGERRMHRGLARLLRAEATVRGCTGRTLYMQAVKWLSGVPLTYEQVHPYSGHAHAAALAAAQVGAGQAPPPSRRWPVGGGACPCGAPAGVQHGGCKHPLCSACLLTAPADGACATCGAVADHTAVLAAVGAQPLLVCAAKSAALCRRAAADLGADPRSKIVVIAPTVAIARTASAALRAAGLGVADTTVRATGSAPRPAEAFRGAQRVGRASEVPRILVVAAAAALDVPEADHVYFVSPPVSAAEAAQGVGRITRLSQARSSVTCTVFVVADSMESNILEATRKQRDGTVALTEELVGAALAHWAGQDLQQGAAGEEDTPGDKEGSAPAEGVQHVVGGQASAEGGGADKEEAATQSSLESSGDEGSPSASEFGGSSFSEDDSSDSDSDSDPPPPQRKKARKA